MADRRLRCGHCGRRFPRRARRGPAPTFCSGACRQAAHRERHALPRDPQTPDEWQEAVDLARLFLLIDSAEQYGLIAGPTVNVGRCEEMLRDGAARGVVPRPDDVIIAEAFAS